MFEKLITTIPVKMRVGFLDGLLPIRDVTNVTGTGANADTQVDFIIGLIRNGLILLFMGVVLVAVVYSALAGYKYVQSQGASDKVEEAQGALKNVLIGVAAAFVGVLGIIIISAIFSDESAINVTGALRCFLDPATCAP